MTQTVQHPRVGIVGVGDISNWHVRALQLAGCTVTAVAARPGSARLSAFAARHAISQVYSDWQTMLTSPDEWDALVIATPPESTPEILAAALGLGVPVLAEKPVAWESSVLQTLCGQAQGQVIVGFNRRFYRTAELARAEAQNGPPLLATLTLPDAITASDNDPTGHDLRPLFDMGSHGLDLLRFVLGDLELSSVQHVSGPDGYVNGFAATLTSERKDVVQVLGNWRTPANYALTLHRPGRRYEMLPLEVATLYEGMDVSEPTDAFPVRRYLPRATEQIFLAEVDRREKPGFVAQARALVRLIRGEPLGFQAATLEDALAAVRLCEALVHGFAPEHVSLSWYSNYHTY